VSVRYRDASASDLRPHVLVLGGTGEARALAARLANDGAYRVTTSLAGRLAAPLLPVGDVRSGSFGGPDGLAAYLCTECVVAVIDATHPFAAAISSNARQACDACRIPLAVLERRTWTELPGDHWHRVADGGAAAIAARALGSRIFLTIGRQGLAPFASVTDRWFLIRCIDAPATALPPQHELMLARGPFALDAEITTLRAFAIDVLVTKASGGDATAAKLTAARACGIPVVVIDRPPASDAGTLNHIDDVVAWLTTMLPASHEVFR